MGADATDYVGFTASAFDLLHPGHVLMLEEAADCCDYLIVGLQVDPSQERQNKSKPIQTVLERYLQLKACKYVDEIIPYETENDLCVLLGTLPINVRFIGEEYKSERITGQDICERRSIHIHYNKRRHLYSSSELRARLIPIGSTNQIYGPYIPGKGYAGDPGPFPGRQ
jgi:glycerol-3-phosphate cytidylyltransferase